MVLYLTNTMNHKTIVAPRYGGKLAPVRYHRESWPNAPIKRRPVVLVSRFRTKATAHDLFAHHCREQIAAARAAIATLGSPKYLRAAPLGDVVALLVADHKALQSKYNQLCAKFDRGARDGIERSGERSARDSASSGDSAPRKS